MRQCPAEIRRPLKQGGFFQAQLDDFLVQGAPTNAQGVRSGVHAPLVGANRLADQFAFKRGNGFAQGVGDVIQMLVGAP